MLENHEPDNIVEKLDKPNNTEIPREDISPTFDSTDILNKHTWRQEGQELICVDNPALSGILPLGVMLMGEKGKYYLEKIF